MKKRKKKPAKKKRIKQRTRLHPFVTKRAIMKNVVVEARPGYPPKTKHTYSFVIKKEDPENYGEDKIVEFDCSVTKLKSEFFEFDAYAISKKVAGRGKYFGYSDNEVQWLWAEKSYIGTEGHDANERFERSGTEFKYTRDVFLGYRDGTKFPKGSKMREAYLIGMNNDQGTKVNPGFWKTLFTDKKGTELELAVSYTRNYESDIGKAGYSTYCYLGEDGQMKKAVEISIYSHILSCGGTFDSLKYNQETKKFFLVDYKFTDKPVRLPPTRLLSEVESTENWKELMKERRFWDYKSYFEYGFQLALYNFILETSYKNNTTFKYDCAGMHILRLNHRSPNYDLTVYKPYFMRSKIMQLVRRIRNTRTQISRPSSGALRAKKGFYYAVYSGREQGIYTNYEDVVPLVSGCHGAKWERFGTLKEAMDYMKHI